jgi:hypothetical protein
VRSSSVKVIGGAVVKNENIIPACAADSTGKDDA